MVSFEAPINKAIIALIIVLVFPMVMISLNEMNQTGFSTMQIAIGTIMGFVIAFGFVKMAMAGGD